MTYFPNRGYLSSKLVQKLIGITPRKANTHLKCHKCKQEIQIGEKYIHHNFTGWAYHQKCI